MNWKLKVHIITAFDTSCIYGLICMGVLYSLVPPEFEIDAASYGLRFGMIFGLIFSIPISKVKIREMLSKRNGKF